MLKKVLIIFFALCAFLNTMGLAQYGRPSGYPELDRGNQLYEKGKYSESKRVFHEVLESEKFEPGTGPWVIAKIGYGVTLLELEDDHGADLIFEAASKAHEDLPLELQAYIKKQLGWANGVKGNTRTRWKVYEEGYQTALQSGDPFRIADLQINMSLISREKNEFEAALDYAQRATDYFRENRSDFHLYLALRNLGIAYRNLAFLDKAIESLLEACAIAEEMENRDLISSAYTFIGLVLKNAGRYDMALYYYEKLLKFAEESGSYLWMHIVTNDIGTVYSFMSDQSSALEYYNRSLEYLSKTGKKNDNLGAVTIQNIGLVYAALGRYSLAEEAYLEALGRFEDPKDFHSITRNYQFLSTLKLRTDSLQAALNYANLAVKRALTTENIELKISALTQLATVYERLGEYDLSLAHYKRAFNMASRGRGFRHTYSLINLSEAFRNVRSDSCYFYADKAFREIEWIRNNIYGDDLQTENFKRYAGFYKEVARWHLEDHGDVETAFRLIEESKSRTLLDHLSSGVVERLLDETSSIKIRQQAKIIDQKYRQLEREKDEGRRSEIRSEIRDLELYYQSALNTLRAENPELRNFEAAQIYSASDLRQKLDRKTAVLQYSVHRGTLISLWLTENDSGFFLQKLRDNTPYISLSGQVSELRESIQNGEPRATIQEKSETLYRLLIEPFKSLRPETERLLIIPDGPLHYLPFEVLIGPDGSYLIENYETKYLPSASTLFYIPDPHRNADKELLAVAGSGIQSGGLLSDSRSQNNFASLPATLIEVDTIATLFDRKLILKNEEVSEAGIKSLSLDAFRYIHFATHGTFDKENPRQSGLILSKQDELETLFGEDGLLNSGEISLLKLNADLVVLSACNTGYGRAVAGEGLLGLQRSFFKAGASSVVVSLWNVIDKSTAYLMSDFYRNLTDYEDEEFGLWNSTLLFLDLYDQPLFDYKSRALRDAKLAMIEHPYYSHPVHWAPFIYIGK